MTDRTKSCSSRCIGAVSSESPPEGEPFSASGGCCRRDRRLRNLHKVGATASRDKWGSKRWHRNIRLTYVTDAQGNVTRYYCNIRGYMYRIAYPDGTEEWMRRDQDNNLVTHVHRDGGIEEMEYDALGNMTKHYRVDGAVIEMGYDDRDHLVSLKDSEGYGWERAYDDAGQLLQYTDCSGKVTKWRYDAEGRLLSHTDPMERVTRFSYDVAGRVASRVDALAYRYDRLGRLTALTDANRATYQFHYDPAGRLAEEIGFDGKRTIYGYSEGTLQPVKIDEGGQVTELEFDQAEAA